MPRPLVVALLVLAVLPAAARAAAPERCPHRGGEHVLARSTEAVVTQRFRTVRDEDGIPYRTVETILGCSRATGVRRVVTRQDVDDGGGGSRVEALKLAGTRVAYETYGGYKDFTETALVADDAVHRGRSRNLSRVALWPYPSEKGILSFAVGHDGTVAWVARGVDDQLLVWHGNALRRRDVGFDLSGPVTVGDGIVRWRHSGQDRFAPVSLPPSRCGGRPARSGTEAIDLTLDAARLTACRRATGASLTAEGNYLSRVPTVDAAGPYVALSDQGAVRRLDLLTGSIDAIPARGSTYARVDEAGSLAWYDQAAPLFSQLWVRDAGGVRAVGDPVAAYASMGRDRAAVRHLETVTPLSP
jgi:hypothetical protein